MTALLTLSGAASALAVSKRTVSRIVARGDLPIFRVGAGVRIRESDLAAYIEGHRIESSQQPNDDLKNLVRRAVERARAKKAEAQR